jgi:hypothetical protein
VGEPSLSHVAGGGPGFAIIRGEFMGRGGYVFAVNN